MSKFTLFKNLTSGPLGQRLNLRALALFEMYMIIYMFKTKTVITIAAGAISEFEVWILGVCFAADGAFVAV